MHNIARNISMAMLATAICLGGCKKDEEAEPAAPAGNNGGNNNSTNGTPVFDGAAGMMWAVRAISTQDTPIGPMEVNTGVGVAFFPASGDPNSYVNAGTVSLEAVELDLQSGNSYVSIPSQTNPTGIDLSNDPTHWTVSGSNGIPAIDRNPGFSFPDAGTITSSATVSRSNGYTLTVASVSNADSVIFQVGDVLKTKAAGTTSCSFSSGELSGLSAGASVVQVAPYRYQSEDIGGLTFYFGKETARSMSVTIE